MHPHRYPEPFCVNFFIKLTTRQFQLKTLSAVPRVGDICVFGEERYRVDRVEWCMDHDASETHTRINIELTKENP